MELTGLLLMFFLSAGYVGYKIISSYIAGVKLDEHEKEVGTNLSRQFRLDHLSYGDTEADRREFLRLYGKDFNFKLASPQERTQAVYEISKKEGWTYRKFEPWAPGGYEPSKDDYFIKLSKKL